MSLILMTGNEIRLADGLRLNSRHLPSEAPVTDSLSDIFLSVSLPLHLGKTEKDTTISEGSMLSINRYFGPRSSWLEKMNQFENVPESGTLLLHY